MVLVGLRFLMDFDALFDSLLDAIVLYEPNDAPPTQLNVKLLCLDFLLRENLAHKRGLSLNRKRSDLEIPFVEQPRFRRFGGDDGPLSDSPAPQVPIAYSLSVFKFLAEITQLLRDGVEIVEGKLLYLFVVDRPGELGPLHFGLSVLFVYFQIGEELANCFGLVVLARLEHLPYQGVPL